MAVLAIAGAVLQGTSAFQKGKADKKAGKLNAAESRLNVAFSESASILEENALRRSQIKHLGNMRAAFGASGLTLEGSPLDVFAESMANAAMDRVTLSFNNELRTRAAQIGAQLDENRSAATNTAANIGAASAALNIARTVSNN